MWLVGNQSAVKAAINGPIKKRHLVNSDSLIFPKRYLKLTFTPLDEHFT